MILFCVFLMTDHKLKHAYVSLKEWFRVDCNLLGIVDWGFHFRFPQKCACLWVAEPVPMFVMGGAAVATTAQTWQLCTWLKHGGNKLVSFSTARLILKNSGWNNSNKWVSSYWLRQRHILLLAWKSASFPLWAHLLVLWAVVMPIDLPL